MTMIERGGIIVMTEAE